MPAYAWACLGVFVAVTAPASLASIVATIRLFRSLKTAAPELETAFERLATGTEALSARTERLAAAMGRAEEASRQVAASRAQLAALMWALEDVRRIVRTIRGFIPSS